MNDHPKLGQLITSSANKDAIHMAVAPIVAGETLKPGQHVSIAATGRAITQGPCIGIVDPFLDEAVEEGEQFWLLLYPGTITSLRHEWTHPALTEFSNPSSRTDSEKWMRIWAKAYMAEGYYEDETPSEEVLYAAAIEAGHTLHAGPNMSVNDAVNDTWWDHWENITGCKGRRDSYFSCAC